MNDLHRTTRRRQRLARTSRRRNQRRGLSFAVVLRLFREYLKKHLAQGCPGSDIEL